MDVERMLEIMTAQKHDFLNYLQVISGLVQMRKEQQVREYINEVVQVLKSLSKVGELELPEVAAALFNAYYLAAKTQVTVQFNVQANLAGCRVPDPKAALVLEGLIDQFLVYLTPTDEQHYLRIDIEATHGGYLCLLCARSFLPEHNFNEPAVCGWARRELTPYGGGLEWQWSSQQIRATVFLPQGR